MGQKECTVAYPFPEHECALDSLRRATITERCWLLRRLWVRYCLVSERDVRARRLFRSCAEFAKEKRRQYDHFKFSIHPYSKMWFAWEGFMAVVYILHALITPIRFSKIFSGYCSGYESPIELFAICDIILGFFTGYVANSESQKVILDNKSIVSHYLRGYFIINMAPMGSLLGQRRIGTRLMALFSILKALRAIVVLKNVGNCFEAMSIGSLKTTLTKIALALVLYIQYNIMLQFLVEYTIEQSARPRYPSECSWMTVTKMWNSTRTVRYVYAFNRAVDMLRQTCKYSLVEQHTCDRIFVVTAFFISKCLYYHCFFRALMLTISSESSEAKYYLMTRQVDTFVRVKKLPKRFKRRIIEYYTIKFRSNFFVESHIMSSVSGQLREDIILHVTRHLVKNVPFLQSLPRQLLVTLTMHIRHEVFLAGDVIFSYNEDGDSLYFIDKGMVAVYSKLGSEVCHLEDGNYFGEVAIVKTPYVRITTVVAVTSCELFRLSREDFKRSVQAYPDVLTNVRRHAERRLEEVAMMDELKRAHEAVRSESFDSDP